MADRPSYFVERWTLNSQTVDKAFIEIQSNRKFTNLIVLNLYKNVCISKVLIF